MTSDQFGPILRSPFFLFILVIGTVYTFLEPLRNAISNEDFGTVTFYIVIIFGAIFLLWYLQRIGLGRTQPLKRNLFHPFEKLDRKTAWPRRSDQHQIVNTIKKAKGKPVILVGDSGVGKSVLVSSQVLPILEDEGWKTVFMDNYSNFQTQIHDQLELVSSHLDFKADGHVSGLDNVNESVILVFDQFEQFLSANSLNTAVHEASRKWFYHFLESASKSPKARTLIVVRKEWYYDLRFLNEFVPPPTQSFALAGLRVEDTEGGIPTLLHRLAQATKNENTPHAVLDSLALNGEISPVEAQIVGCMLENKTAKLGEITSESYGKQLGSKEVLIQDFFDITLRSSPNREITLQILFALSIETRYRRQLTLSQIVGIIHKPRNEVIDCLHFLEEQRLVHQRDAEHYQLTHDYLAERFHDLSGSELDPKERDNILFFGDEIRKDDRAQITENPEPPRVMSLISDWFMAFLALLVSARVLGPLYGVDWNCWNNFATLHITATWIDMYYLPVFVTHLAWSYYVTIFYRRFFSLLKDRETTIGRFLSVLTLFTCAASVILAVIFPYFWVFSIGFGGFWIGVKLLQLSIMEGLSTVSKDVFRITGRETALNSLFPIILGGAYAYSIHTRPPSLDMLHEYAIVSIVAMFGLTYAMLNVRHRHVTRKAASIWLGMYDRRPKKLIQKN
ncbi:MAG: hypothetical protein ABR936_14900 [Bacteroidota bacterium]|jgi:hypothetical protein